ncbi:MAG: M14 family metallopeptidase [Victivallales bacterium]|nr:M14 family metallopeptidase [Victivallales bacterium]
MREKFNFDPYLNFKQLADFCHKLTKDYPHLARCSSIGKSQEGRPLLLLTISDFASGEAEDKPAFLMQAHIHSHELAGTPCLLHVARSLVQAHQKGGLLENCAFYILPRINPDGAEKMIEHAGWDRSRQNWSKHPNALKQCDIDGNGLVLQMRRERPDGDWCTHPDDPRAVIRRRADSKGPFYRLYREGVIDNWDGFSSEPDSLFELVDWNRNWGADWKNQGNWGMSSGEFPLSVPEVRALGKFIAERDNLFMAVGYHNGFGHILLPPCSDTIPVDVSDMKVFEKLGKTASGYLGYPWCSTFPGYNYAKEKPYARYGLFDSHLYALKGVFALTIELGTIEHALGLSTESILAHDDAEAYMESEDVRLRCIQFCDKNPKRRKVFHDWKKIKHPQMGELEVGGFDWSVFAVPVKEQLAEICEANYQFIIRAASWRPRIEILESITEEIADACFRVRVKFFNNGELPEFVSEQKLKNPHCHLPLVTLKMGKNVNCLSQKLHRDLKHFSPWAVQECEWFFKGRPSNGVLAELMISAGAAGSAKHTIKI